MSARTHRLRPPRTAILFAALLLAVVFAADTRARAEEPAPPDSTQIGEHCSVTCGRFKEDTCEIWDEAGAPSCECTIGDIGAYTRCRCADGSEPEGCRCSNAPHEACDSNNPQDDCGSCRCQC
jgi:hypothetical protein